MNRTTFRSLAGLFCALDVCHERALSSRLYSRPPRPAADLPYIRFENLFTLEHPTYAIADPLGRFFFVEQAGRIRLYENGKLDETPYLDITKKTFLDYENGLASIAFHPKFAENGLFYAFYAVNLAPQPPPVTQPATAPARGRGRRGRARSRRSKSAR